MNVQLPVKLTSFSGIEKVLPATTAPGDVVVQPLNDQVPIRPAAFVVAVGVRLARTVTFAPGCTEAGPGTAGVKVGGKPCVGSGLAVYVTVRGGARVKVQLPVKTTLLFGIENVPPATAVGACAEVQGLNDHVPISPAAFVVSVVARFPRTVAVAPGCTEAGPGIAGVNVAGTP